MALASYWYSFIVFADLALIIGPTVSITVIIIVVVVVYVLIWRRRRQRRGRMATSSVLMRRGQDGDQTCLIFNQQPVAPVMPVGYYIPANPAAGRLAFGPPPTEKGVLEPIVPFQSYITQPFELAVCQPMQSSTAEPLESSSYGQQLVAASRDDLA